MKTWTSPSSQDSEKLLFFILELFHDAPYCCALLTPLQSDESEKISIHPTNHPIKYKTFHWLLGIGLKETDRDEEPINNQNFGFPDFNAMLKRNPGFRMGYFTYEMSNLTKRSNNTKKPNAENTSPAFWFRPSLLIKCDQNKLEFLIDQYDNFQYISHKIKRTYRGYEVKCFDLPKIKFKSTIKLNDYCKKIDEIKQNITDGNYYELNYCIERRARMAIRKPLNYWIKMVNKSKAPFSAYLKQNMTHIMCASPERFLRKEGNQLLSQPIKGTAKRYKNHNQDHASFTNLTRNTKEMAEHLMIVDLVRNDLTKCSGSVSTKVLELAKTCSFNTIHQLISSVQTELEPNHSITDILESCFPMGSMTGTPKQTVCNRIPILENQERGIFSGALGYFDSNLNFDLNVVIRTIIYDQTTNLLSLKTGGAITIDSNPEKEWKECILKCQSIS